jgi:localization factor PodJL
MPSIPQPVSANADVTGSIPDAAPATDPSQPNAVDGAVYTDQLPNMIGGTPLRMAAVKGDPTAAYEIGVRFAEGRGVAANFEEAAKWYQRAADNGVVMASFRLGTLYEKGLGLKKNLDTARRYYVIAAERGNGKAMHNIAVLDADGGGKGPDYKSASEWFRKAAVHGIADSQYNLGILYARGIGVDQNLAESFKWFSLAAAQGDADAGRKRDDIASHLDPQSLAAARLAVQTFAPEPQPADATTVATPPGGWDRAPPATAPTKRADKPTASKPATVKRASK